MPKWMSGVDALTPQKAFGLGALLAGVSPKNLVLAASAGATLAGVGPATSEAVGSLIVFVAGISIAAPVFYRLAGGEHAKAPLDEMKDWLVLHNDAVMAALFLIFGANLIANGLPPLTT